MAHHLYKIEKACDEIYGEGFRDGRKSLYDSVQRIIGDAKRDIRTVERLNPDLNYQALALMHMVVRWCEEDPRVGAEIRAQIVRD